MSTAPSDHITPSESQERIYLALKKTLEAFFEGRGLSIEQQITFIQRAQKDLAPPAPKKSAPSKVKIGSERDIVRMWAKHEKKTRKPK